MISAEASSHCAMQLGGFYIWTHTYSCMKNAGELYKRMKAADDAVARTPNGDADANGWAQPKAGSGGTEKDLEAPLLPSTSPSDEGSETEQSLSVRLPCSVTTFLPEFAKTRFC